MGSQQLFVNDRFIFDEFLCNRCERLLQLRISGLRSCRFGPVKRQIEVTASIIDLIHFSRGRFVLLQEFCNRRIQGLSQDVRLLVIERRCQVLERRPERKELTERVPTQVPFLLKLLHVFWR